MSVLNQPITDTLQTKCRSCGGYMHYTPVEQNLKCVYCGSITDLDKTAAEIVENDFLYWKDRADENNDEEIIDIAEIKCRQCGATTTLPENVSGGECAFCATPLIMNEAAVRRFWQPEYLLPFQVSEKTSQENFKKWLGKKWFLPSQLKKTGVMTDKFKGVYLPFWTYDANTHTTFSGKRGVRRSQVSRDSKGAEVKRTVTDWYNESGSFNLFFDDIVVPASNSMPKNIMNQLTNWDMMNSVKFRKEFLAGFITEIYQRDFRESIDDAKKKMDMVIEDNIKAHIGGDEQKITSSYIEYNDLKFKHLLLPVWISAFKFNGKLYQFVINGRTGQVIGEYPKDKSKIIILVVGIVAVIAALFMLLS